MWRICRNLVIACLGMFLLMPLSVLAESPTLDHVIAIVNEDPIFSSQLEERIQLIEGLNAQSRSKAPAPDELRRQILEQLILEALQLDIAQRSSVKISDEEFQGTLENIAQQNHLDLPGLEKALSADGINFNSYKQYIREQLLIDRIQHIAVGKRLSISEQDITNFLNSEEGKLMSSPTYHLAHILLPLPSDLSPEDKRATEATSQQIIDDIHNKRADFQTLAKQYSKAQDASSGGDLGWHRKADLPTLYAAQVDRLSVGEVSQPFQAGGGIHILMLLEKRTKRRPSVKYYAASQPACTGPSRKI